MARDYTPKTWDGLASAVARDVYKKIGNKMAKDMSQQYQKAIHAFYADYKPKAYRRKFRSYFFAGDSWAGKGGAKDYRKFLKMDSDGKGFTVRMLVSPGNLTTPYSSIVNGTSTASLTGLVFANTWIYGQHGGKLPYDIIPEDLRYTNGMTQNGWKPLKDTGWTWIPPRMKEPPVEMMDKWFASYATDANLNKLTQDIVTASINRYIARATARYGGIK